MDTTEDCQGDVNDHASNILACPLHQEAVGILCNADKGSNNGADPKKDFVCHPAEGSESAGGSCVCKKGQFCCNYNVQVPGGEMAMDYFKGAGCGCDG